MKTLLSLLLVTWTHYVFSASTTNEWTRLFNGRNFDGLDRYLAAPPGSKEPLGLNNDPRGVFTITNVDNLPAIHVSGEIYGAVTTHAEFGNAHIRVQYKWGEKKWPQRAQPKHYRDAGLLYWCIGPNGAGSHAWMRSIECNIMEKGVGQWWGVADTYCDVEGRNVVLEKEPSVPYRGESPGEQCVVWQRGAPTYTVKPYEGITSPLDTEKPHGEWNLAEVIAWGNVCIHLLNGQVVLVITNPRFKENGLEQRLNRGKIQLQSEAAELYYSDLEAQAIDSIPAEFLQYVPIEPQHDSGFTSLFGQTPTDRWTQCGPGNLRWRTVLRLATEAWGFGGTPTGCSLISFFAENGARKAKSPTPASFSVFRRRAMIRGLRSDGVMSSRSASPIRSTRKTVRDHSIHFTVR